MKDVSLLENNEINVDASLELLGDMEMYDELLNDFSDESSERLDDLENYKNNEDMANYAILVHAIKSDSKYLGFEKLADLMFQHEMKSKENNQDFVNDNYDELIEEFNRIINVVNKYLEK